MQNSRIRIGFFGTPELAASVLRDIIADSRFLVTCVVTNPDKPVGRSKESRPSPVKANAMEHQIPVMTPLKIRGNTQFFDELRAYQCDYFVVVAYGKILPQELLDIPSVLSVNVHGSILPKYRGASPIQSALLAGEKQTGVTIMQMSAGMDEGAMLAVHTIDIAPDETSKTLFEKFAKVSGQVLCETLVSHFAGNIFPQEQKHEEATYCQKIEKTDGQIDWNESALKIYRKWQAYTPWPGIFTYFEWKRLVVESPQPRIYTSTPENFGEEWRSYVETGTIFGEVGEVVWLPDGNIGVICGEGVLVLNTVKLEGKSSQPVQAFIHGNPQFISYTL